VAVLGHSNAREQVGGRNSEQPGIAMLLRPGRAHSAAESVCGDGDGPVIVAMIVVWMMQVAVDDVIGMVAMRDCDVTAIHRVDVTGGLFGRAVAGGALRGIRGADGDGVFVHVRTMCVMQMAAIKVISMTVMRDGEMAAAGAVLMLVSLGVFMVRATGGDKRQWCDEE
jgi:hypothetical protein